LLFMLAHVMAFEVQHFSCSFHEGIALFVIEMKSCLST
jgi:hypothetical protein